MYAQYSCLSSVKLGEGGLGARPPGVVCAVPPTKDMICVFSGNHLSNTTCLTLVSFNSGEEGSKSVMVLLDTTKHA